MLSQFSVSNFHFSKSCFLTFIAIILKWRPLLASHGFPFTFSFRSMCLFTCSQLSKSCKNFSSIPLTPMGVLAHRLRTLDRSLVPPSTWAEICWHMCLQSHLQASPPTSQKSYPKFRNNMTTFGNTPLCPPNYSIVWGVGGAPIFVVDWNHNIYVT